MVMTSPRSFFWRNVSVVTFLRAVGVLVGTGANVDMGILQMVGAVFVAIIPLSPRLGQLVEIFRRVLMDTRGVAIIPQNAILRHGKIYKSFVSVTASLGCAARE